MDDDDDESAKPQYRNVALEERAITAILNMKTATIARVGRLKIHTLLAGMTVDIHRYNS
jgi:hypothetical protein